MLVKLNTDVYLLEYPPHPLCSEKLNKSKLEGLRINNDGLCLTS